MTCKPAFRELLPAIKRLFVLTFAVLLAGCGAGQRVANPPAEEQLRVDIKYASRPSSAPLPNPGAALWNSHGLNKISQLNRIGAVNALSHREGLSVSRLTTCSISAL